MTPPNQVLQLINRSERERLEHNLTKYNHPDHKEARVRPKFTAPFLQMSGWDAPNVHIRRA